MRKNLPCRIDQLIQVMSEIQTNLSLNLLKFNSSWVNSGGMEGGVLNW
jgi:hypothetical protein